MADKLVVNAGGKEFEVEVSAGGMFYDKDTKNVSAKTLDGLKKKLEELHGPKGGVPVEKWLTGKRGIVIGRVKSKGWRRSYVNVRWADGKVTEEWPNSLCPPISPEVRAEKEKLGKLEDKAKEAWEAASQAVAEHRNKYQIEGALEVAFPMK